VASKLAKVAYQFLRGSRTQGWRESKLPHAMATARAKANAALADPASERAKTRALFTLRVPLFKQLGSQRIAEA
jgi:hypothetical protein